MVPRFATNERAVALGLPRTGRIVTVAATVMAIVFVAVIASQVQSMRMLGYHAPPQRISLCCQPEGKCMAAVGAALLLSVRAGDRAQF